MTSRPAVSVCVPTYNYGRFLRDCIESVLAQTLADWELVITDDASSDDTEAIVTRYAAADARVRYVRNPERLGMTGNLRRAAGLGRGRYLKMLCADDWLAPGCLGALHGLMEAHPAAVLATAAEIHTDAEGRPLRVQFLFGKPLSVFTGEAMLDRMARGQGFGGNSSFFIRAEAYHGVGGYDATVKYASDYDLAARLCRTGDYLHTDEPLFYGRHHAAASSVVDPANLLDVTDRFGVPARVFQPRRFGNRDWRRHHRLATALTAQYLLNAVLESLRGRRQYARQLVGIVAREGNLWLGVPLLALHVPARIGRRIARSLTSTGRRPEAWMMAPTRRA